jgi:hypothetical protein
MQDLHKESKVREMKNTMTIAEALEQINLDEKAWLHSEPVTKMVQEMLLGPVTHYLQLHPETRQPWCYRCEREWPDYLEPEEVPNEIGDCPVPPPLAMEPEVVAERLRLKAQVGLIEAIIHVSWECGHKNHYLMNWWIDSATTVYHHILACLVAGGKVGDE